mmetsp:Transcript_42192/g.92482  ORF Transcript_42192/g.92482 Transcript_42192/m.92482 type:complete len:200 (+) Transcript_42192:400-999(+)|eukprot:975147-Pleurochrysis_carterae.AAC.1
MGVLSPSPPRFADHGLVVWFTRKAASTKKEESSFKTLNSIGRMPSGHRSPASSPSKQVQQRQRACAGQVKKAAEPIITPPRCARRIISSPDRLKRMPRTWPTQLAEPNRRYPSPNRFRPLQKGEVKYKAPHSPPQTIAVIAGGSMREPQQNIEMVPCYYCGDAIEDFRVRYAEYKHNALPRHARFTCCDCVWLGHTYKR